MLYPSNLQAKNRNTEMLLVALLAIIAVILARFHYAGIALSDEYLYTERAWQLLQGTFVHSPSAFDNRFGWLLPQSLTLRWFGPTAVGYVGPSMLGLLLLLISAWWAGRIIDRRIGLIAAALIAFNPGLLNLAGDVSPDLLMAGLAAPGIVLLARRAGKRPVSRAVLIAFFFFVAFCTKISVLYLLPWLLVIAGIDLGNRKNRRFWLSFGLSILVLAILWLAAYGWYTGNAFYRWYGIESEHNVSEWGYYGKPMADIIARVTYYPLALLNGSGTLGFLLVMVLTGIKRVHLRPRSPLFFWTSLLFIQLALHWLGSTSFQSYNPLPLYDRMWLLLVLPAVVLATVFFRDAPKQSRLRRGILVTIVLASISGHFFLGYRFPFFWLTGFTALLFVLPIRRNIVTGTLLAALLLAQFFGIRESQGSNLLQEYAFFDQLDRSEKILIVTDSILVSKPLVHLRFQPQENVQLIHWREWNATDRTGLDEHIWLIFDPAREQIMATYFGWPIPPRFGKQFPDLSRSHIQQWDAENQ